MIDSDNRNQMQASAAKYRDSTFFKLVYAAKRMNMTTEDAITYVKNRHPEIHAEMLGECNLEDPRQFHDIDVNAEYQGTEFSALVEHAMTKDKLSRGEAVTKIAREFPDIHEAAIAAANGLAI